MELVTEKSAASFDLTKIGRGYLLWGRHRSWTEGKSGFVTSAAPDLLIVQYHPGIGNVTNHFKILVSEVTDGQWELKWSADLSQVWEYETVSADAGQERKEEEGVGCNDAGRVDL